VEVVGRQALIELSESYADCEKCPLLKRSRTQVVFGGGSSKAPIVIVGGAPHSAEDAEGAAFVGDAGQLFMDVIAKAWPACSEMAEISKIGEDRSYFSELRDYLDQYIFWTNTAMCMPDENRPPSAVEVKNCLDRLHRSIYAVDPLLIVATGKTAASALVGKAVAITDKRGRIFDIEIPSPVTGNPVRYPMLAILDPAFLLKEGDQKLVKRKQGKTYQTIKDLEFGFALVDQLHRDSYGRPFLEK
jgi:DNA polymerase